MARWCVDANVVIATLLEENRTSQARSFWISLAADDEVIVPCVLFPECTSVIRRTVVSGALTEAEGYEKLGELLALPLRISTQRAQFSLAFDWATRGKRAKTNDLQYVAVAQLEGAEIVSLDGGMQQAAREQNVPVRFLQ